MAKPKRDPVREDRIQDEVIVDAYGPEEQAMGWYYYLESKIRFPFQAKCIVAKAVSPLLKGETAEVQGMAPEEACSSDMLVLIKWQGRTMAVPLSPTAVHQGEQSHRRSHRGLALLGRPGLLFLSSPRLLTVHAASLKESGTCSEVNQNRNRRG
jgi:Calcium binding